MNILFLTLTYPENASSRGIYIDLMKELKNRGNNITVVTPIERRNNKDTYISFSDGIKVLRVKSGNIQKTNKIEKGISTLLIESQFIKAIRDNLSDVKYDLIMYSTPPITFERVIKFIKDRDNAKSYLLLKDIFPQNAVDLSMISEKGLIYKYFRKKEERLYKISDYIGCMSEKNKEYILKHNNWLSSEKVEICPNSIEPLEFSEISKSEKLLIREKHNLPKDAIICVYGGNLGKPQGIDFLIKVLDNNKNNTDIFFLIVGGGTEYNKISNWIKSNAPDNCLLLSMLPKEDYDNLIKACDIGLILLDNRFTIPNFPSRILSYMEIGIPVIAATDKNTDIGDVITAGNFGYWCESRDLAGFNNIIKNIINSKDELINIGRSGRVYLEKNYTVKTSADIIIKKI
ncbi:glycosyltransferase family 4 protein [Clostridium tertium]|uniref:glycosyltransferase family 4 protein n=1 Tax=Clostridium tertium TaxID=1559 RepID=UPI0023300CDE|nr:glycosyltransferase family 4 protein [Clostridium tertium]MDB1921732.1 glycosyltransferase family 4 protein [Clostridium tertium]MDB1924935.1 glycosyltransferase family 4 protein [Clostridium tertium]MDB1929574.1 glycosyltransferase family 4 protein [Clostridium tertium]